MNHSLLQEDLDQLPSGSQVENQAEGLAEIEGAGRPVRHTRKLFDKILVSFHHACDLGDLEVADSLLPILETMTTRRQHSEDHNRRRNIEGLVAAHERLWHLRHPVIR